jgi:hypothetical protein
MKNNLTVARQLMAFILWGSLFLQSCGNPSSILPKPIEEQATAKPMRNHQKQSRQLNPTQGQLITAYNEPSILLIPQQQTHSNILTHHTQHEKSHLSSTNALISQGYLKVKEHTPHPIQQAIREIKKPTPILTGHTVVTRAGQEVKFYQKAGVWKAAVVDFYDKSNLCKGFFIVLLVLLSASS